MTTAYNKRTTIRYFVYPRAADFCGRYIGPVKESVVAIRTVTKRANVHPHGVPYPCSAAAPASAAVARRKHSISIFIKLCTPLRQKLTKPGGRCSAFNMAAEPRARAA
ncbi:hypothetical protein EVAR_24246_1 [Eumeta japonica]|uniref:Uncharacterized protein n=1 Tax=Eumeta variegata TaxID=151549 RepID=A0A4C1W687_EUMVA|nr:hypothetical protein EVAR_24246_1 [Eumeta japonica]